MDSNTNVLDFDPDEYDINCMLDLLSKTDEYKLLFDYCFPVKRHLGLVAIYNINTFLPSIGQFEFGEQESRILPFIFEAPSSDFARPYSTDGSESEFESVSEESSGNEPWGDVSSVNSSILAAVMESLGFDSGPGGFLGFRMWDQDSFEDTRKTIKKTFRDYYHADDPSYKDEDEEAAGGMKGSLRDRLQPARIDRESEPWWKKRRRKKQKYGQIEDEDCDDS